jgi:hypothetical protein
MGLQGLLTVAGYISTELRPKCKTPALLVVARADLSRGVSHYRCILEQAYSGESWHSDLWILLGGEGVAAWVIQNLIIF